MWGTSGPDNPWYEEDVWKVRPSDAPELGKPEDTPRELRTASLDRSLLNRSPEEMLEKIKAYVEPIRLTIYVAGQRPKEALRPRTAQRTATKGSAAALKTWIKTAQRAVRLPRQWTSNYVDVTAAAAAD